MEMLPVGRCILLRPKHTLLASFIGSRDRSVSSPPTRPPSIQVAFAKIWNTRQTALSGGTSGGWLSIASLLGLYLTRLISLLPLVAVGTRVNKLWPEKELNVRGWQQQVSREITAKTHDNRNVQKLNGQQHKISHCDQHHPLRTFTLLPPGSHLINTLLGIVN